MCKYGVVSRFPQFEQLDFSAEVAKMGLLGVSK